jgi:hypothetical protein
VQQELQQDAILFQGVDMDHGTLIMACIILGLLVATCAVLFKPL